MCIRDSGWDYKVQFTGPTGADAVEAALKLARKATGRTKVCLLYTSIAGIAPAGPEACELLFQNDDVRSTRP